ncbi:MAG: holo-ACP synthase [Alphaproteobacteria bacterium]|nr:holo-ACP synthase [Alphaproteobacteria bacterium]
MILGIGTDIVNISRIEESINKFGDSFIKRCFTESEIAESNKKKERACFFAKRFAAKEAFFKALGTGFTHRVSWQDVNISNNEYGKPEIEISGTSKDILEKISKDAKIFISMSDDAPYATATIIIEG